MKSFPIPQNQHDVRSFLGLANYYRKFVKGYSKVALPLNRLLTKNTPFKWTTECQDAFKLLKEKLTNTPLLAYPDFRRQFILSCDASGMAIEYILSQIGDDNKEHVIAYGGRALNNAEKANSVTEQEMLALISAIDHFRVYLINNHFLVNTDHKALTWLKTIKYTNARLIRWALKLQEFTFDLKHRPGAKHQNCDALSRRPYAENSQNDQNTENDNDLLQMDRIETTFIYEKENPEEILQMAQEKSGKNLPDENQISQQQQNCPYFKHMYEYLQHGNLPDDKKRAKAIPYEAQQYEIFNNVLYHIFQPRYKNKVNAEIMIKQLAVPEVLRNDVIRSYHDSLAGGCHLGIQRTYMAIKQKYFWPKMYQNVYDYITSCDVCQRVKRDTTARNAPLHPLPVQDRFHRWHMDILAGLPKTKEGYQYILLVTDSLTHWSEALPMRTQEATEVAYLLYNVQRNIY